MEDIFFAVLYSRLSGGRVFIGAVIQLEGNNQLGLSPSTSISYSMFHRKHVPGTVTTQFLSYGPVERKQ